MVCGSEESGEIPKAPKDTAAPESPSTGTTDKAGEVPKAPKDTAAPESPTAGTTDKAASDSDDNLSPPQLERASGNQIYVETVRVLHLVNGDAPGAVPLNSKKGRSMICDGPKNVLLLKDKPENQSTAPAEEDVGMDIDVDSDDELSHKEEHEGDRKKPGTSRPSDSSSDSDDSSDDDDEVEIVGVKKAQPKADSDSDDSDSSSVSSDDSHLSGDDSKARPSRAIEFERKTVDSARAHDSATGTTESEDNNNESDVGTDGATSTRPSTTVAASRALTVAPNNSGTGGGPSSSSGKRKATSTNFLQYSVTEPVSKKKKYMQKGPTPKKLLEALDEAASYLAERPTFNKFDKKLENVRKQEYYFLKAVRESYKKKKEQASKEDESMAVDGDDKPRSALPHRRNGEGGAPGASGVSA